MMITFQVYLNPFLVFFVLFILGCDRMFDDISFVPAQISIMSKLKQSPHSVDHSLSRIIREQALIYEEEVPDQDIAFCMPKSTGTKKNKSSKQSKPESHKRQDSHGTKVKEPFKKQNLPTYACKVSPSRPKIEKVSINSPSEEQIRTTQRKVNLLVFEDLDQPTDRSPSKKEKRTIKQTFDEQKTRKIDFQDVHMYDSPQKKNKKDQVTKIKHQEYLLPQNSSCKKGILELVSKQSSDMQSEDKDTSVLVYQTKSNYKVLMSQVKELIAMNRWECIQLEKVELRKQLVKTDTEIKRLKIGFRGLSESCDMLCRNKSKLKSRESSESTIKKSSGLRSKIKSKANNLYPDYGQDEFEPQLSKSCIQSSNLKEKMEYLQEEIKKTRKQEIKLKYQLSQISSKYNQMKQNAHQHQKEFMPTPSTINRAKILKEKVEFLKTEIKETKKYYSNRIKRFKNQNTLFKNQTIYTNKEIEEIKKCIKNIEKTQKKYREQMTDKKDKANDNYRLKTEQCISKVNSIRDSSNNLLSIDPKSVKSINSINSLRSINSAQSITPKPSLGSINSYKSTKQTSGDTGTQDLQNHPSKPKLKISSPHVAVIPSVSSTKQYSTLAKRKHETQVRLGLKDGGVRDKKPTSLDIAFKQLQQKYEVHLDEPNKQTQYYNRIH